MAIIRNDCPHCGLANAAMTAFGISVWPDATHEIAFASVGLLCPECHKPCASVIAASAHRNASSAASRFSTWFGTPHGPDTFHIAVQSVWPEPAAPIVPDGIPREAARAFEQAEDNFSRRGMRESAAAMYGRALDVGLKVFENAEAGERRGMLYERIERLVTGGHLPPKIADWAHAVRALRNDALHDLSDLTAEELVAIRGFTETVMRYLFTLPKMIDDLRAETQAAEAPPPN